MLKTDSNLSASMGARPGEAGRTGRGERASGLPRSLEYLYVVAPQPCPYLPGRVERKLVARLDGEDAQSHHDALVHAGFRRTRDLIYRPACPGCSACVPLRVLAQEFSPTRSLKRVERLNGDLMAVELPPVARIEHYRLFAAYLGTRHADGEMMAMDFADYRAMVEDTPIETLLVEFRDSRGKLIAVSLTDVLADGLSGVYKFFDPAESKRSPGTFVILWHIGHARDLGLPHVYLGYWIAECRKMSYKNRFRPFEVLGPKGWRRGDAGRR